MVVLPSFVAQDVLRAIQRYKPTIFPGVPTMYAALAQFQCARYGIDSIKACISGAAPLPVEVQESFEKLTPRPAGGRLWPHRGHHRPHANPWASCARWAASACRCRLPRPALWTWQWQALPPGQVGELSCAGRR